jgi:hypothetical protein
MKALLSPDSISDLQFLFCEFASAIGVSSSFQPLVQMAMSGGPECSRWVDTVDERVFRAIARARRIEAVFFKLSRAHATVLFKVYGPSYKHAPFGRFGLLSPLLELVEPSRDTIERQLDDQLYVRRLKNKAQTMFTAACKAYNEAK